MASSMAAVRALNVMRRQSRAFPSDRTPRLAAVRPASARSCTVAPTASTASDTASSNDCGRRVMRPRPSK